jgi:hypothetical protein
MRLSLATALVAGLGWIGFAAAHNIQLKAHSRECFHEELHRDDKMTVTFQVGDREFGGSGNLDIDFYVRFPLRPCCHLAESRNLADPRPFRQLRDTPKDSIIRRLLV